MADVYLQYDSGRPITNLPPVCIKCGRPAGVCEMHQFSWQPPWLVLLSFAGLIAIDLLTRSKTVETPLCYRHKSYWWVFPTLVMLACPGVLFFGLVATCAFAINHANKLDDSSDFLLPCPTTVLLFFAVLCGAVVLQWGRVRATKITDHYIRLSGVSPEFADAVEQEDAQRRQAFDRHVEDRRERRPLKEDDDRYRDKQGDSRYES
jgi:hypothetical protein